MAHKMLRAGLILHAHAASRLSTTPPAHIFAEMGHLRHAAYIAAYHIIIGVAEKICYRPARQSSSL